MKVIVMAKEPIPGSVKTRLCPPCSPGEAARLAAAAIADTLDAALASAADEVVLALDGGPGGWCPPGVRVIPQVTGAFGERLAAAWSTVGGPAVQVGMDTPQVTAAHLDDAMRLLGDGGRDGGGADAVLGDALDGGWWLLGLRVADRRVFDGVPMSTADTGRHQRRRLVELGLTVADVTPLIDVDTIDDARVVALGAPDSAFSDAMRRMDLMAVPVAGGRS